MKADLYRVQIANTSSRRIARSPWPRRIGDMIGGAVVGFLGALVMIGMMR